MRWMLAMAASLTLAGCDGLARMRRTVRILSGILLGLGTTRATAQSPADRIAGDTLDPRPAWSTEETAIFLSRATGFCGRPPALPGVLTRIRLLAWEDGTRPDGQAISRGFWWGQGIDSIGQPFWILAKGYRIHGPSRPASPREFTPAGWQLDYVCDIPGHPLTIVRAPPTGADAAARAPGWAMGRARGSAVVRPRTWEATFGAPVPPSGGRPDA
ncbi:MAG: hypothetical protein JNJ80_17910 [Gemmatimonadetes bacterium]|nr:hypothetical protein [Gemmatimonadota bacterium]